MTVLLQAPAPTSKTATTRFLPTTMTLSIRPTVMRSVMDGLRDLPHCWKIPGPKDKFLVSLHGALDLRVILSSPVGRHLLGLEEVPRSWINGSPSPTAGPAEWTRTVYWHMPSAAWRGLIPLGSDYRHSVNSWLYDADNLVIRGNLRRISEGRWTIPQDLEEEIEDDLALARRCASALEGYYAGGAYNFEGHQPVPLVGDSAADLLARVSLNRRVCLDLLGYTCMAMAQGPDASTFWLVGTDVLQLRQRFDIGGPTMRFRGVIFDLSVLNASSDLDLLVAHAAWIPGSCYVWEPHLRLSPAKKRFDPVELRALKQEGYGTESVQWPYATAWKDRLLEPLAPRIERRICAKSVIAAALARAEDLLESPLKDWFSETYDPIPARRHFSLVMRLGHVSASPGAAVLLRLIALARPSWDLERLLSNARRSGIPFTITYIEPHLSLWRDIHEFQYGEVAPAVTTNGCPVFNLAKLTLVATGELFQTWMFALAGFLSARPHVLAAAESEGGIYTLLIQRFGPDYRQKEAPYTPNLTLDGPTDSTYGYRISGVFREDGRIADTMSEAERAVLLGRVICADNSVKWFWPNASILYNAGHALPAATTDLREWFTGVVEGYINNARLPKTERQWEQSGLISDRVPAAKKGTARRVWLEQAFEILAYELPSSLDGGWTDISMMQMSLYEEGPEETEEDVDM